MTGISKAQAVSNEVDTPVEPRKTVAYFSKASLIGPSSRYRIYQFVPYLDAAGIDCRIYPLFGPGYFRILEMGNPLLRVLAKVGYVAARFVKRGWDLLMGANADAVVVEGQLFPYAPAWMERLITKSFKQTAIELDDAIYLTRFHGTKIPGLLNAASISIVGNETLARYARQYASTVMVIPTVVDTVRFSPGWTVDPTVQQAHKKPVTVVWLGLAYNLGYLDLVVPTLRDLSRQGLIRVRIICSHAPELDGVDVEFRQWSIEREADDLRECDIGIMPLPDSEWARAKCGLKLLQYMACGLATVASPIGVNADIIKDGETGLLASSQEDWHDKLTQLCRDHEQRLRLGVAGRRRVEESYSLVTWGERLADTYRRLANGPTCSGRAQGLTHASTTNVMR
jgi:glycosyltransferase involved in cell wall biosynthesis